MPVYRDGKIIINDIKQINPEFICPECHRPICTGIPCIYCNVYAKDSGTFSCVFYSSKCRCDYTILKLISRQYANTIAIKEQLLQEQFNNVMLLKQIKELKEVINILK